MSRRAKTSGDALLNAALQIADDVGITRLTIRRVAAAAGVAPMTLYWHFASKDELLDQMGRELSRRLYGVAEHSTWQAGLRNSCHGMRDLLLAHPKWAPLIARPTPATDAPGRERLLELMVHAGMTPQQAFAHVAQAGLLTLSMTLLELQYRDRQGTSIFAKRFEKLRLLRDDPAFAAQCPTTRAALAESPPLDFPTAFSATLDAFIAGTERNCEATTGGRLGSAETSSGGLGAPPTPRRREPPSVAVREPE